MSTTATLFTRITPAQRAAIFAAGQRLGLDLDGLRDLTPRGSISDMSVVEAGQLLDRLNKGTDFQNPARECGASAIKRDAHVSKRSFRKPRATAGVIRLVSDGQREMLDQLCAKLGWTKQGLHDFLAERHFSYDPQRPMTQMNTARDAHAVIELLKAILRRKDAAATQQRSADGVPF